MQIDIEREMLNAVEEVQKTGESMSAAARDFATDPCSSAKRGNMVRTVFIISMHYISLTNDLQATW